MRNSAFRTPRLCSWDVLGGTERPFFPSTDRWALLALRPAVWRRGAPRGPDSESRKAGEGFPLKMILLIKVKTYKVTEDSYSSRGGEWEV